MKDSLLPIYRAVAEGRLTQAEALVRIKALKQRNADAAQQGTILATRQWTSAPAAPAGDAGGSPQAPQKILLWGVASETTAFLRKHLSAADLVEIAPPGSKETDASFAQAALQCFGEIKSLLANKAGRAKRIGLLLVAVDSPGMSVATGLEALLRTAMEENPALSARFVRVPADIEPAQLLQSLQRESASSGEQASSGQDVAVRYRRDGKQLEREASRWRLLAKAGSDDAALHAPVIFKEGGCYLITGGAGGIGLQFAREIIAQTARVRIVLAGRSAPSAGTAEILRTLATAQHKIDYVVLDVAQAEAVDALVARLRSEGQPLTGIVHCAGITRDSFIIRKSTDEFASVLSPKVAGVGNLDRATRDTKLDFMLMCSSIAACWGINGQADYATGNGFMDAFAEYRNGLVGQGQRSGRTLSVNWPFWQDGGMTLDAATHERMQGRTGMQPLKTATAMRAVHRGFALDCDRLLVMEGELSAMQALLDHADVAPRNDRAGDAGQEDASAAISADAPSTDDAFRAKSLEYLCQQFSIVLKIPVVKLRPDAPLENYGMDSILAMKLVTHLESIFGKLPKTLAFEYQTIAQLNDYFCATHATRLADVLAPQLPQAPRAARTPAVSLQKPASMPHAAQQASQQHVVGKRIPPTRAAAAPVPPKLPAAEQPPVLGRVMATEPVAIVGLSGRYPEARNLDDYWRNLAEGKDCIREIPAQRWRWQDYFRDVAAGEVLGAGQHSSKWGGFIEGADEFDPRFFNITPRDAEQIDPQERLFLQYAWMAIEDAGYTRDGLQGRRGGQVGVYAGVMYGEYNRSGSLASIANRVSYVLNLRGPSMTLDTMCSSSLTAIHLACQDLRLGRTDMALAGGVNLSIHPGKYSMLSGGQFISSAGHCQSFGEGGDGYIPGEGVGVVVLKRLSDAERDGDAIHAIIRSSALNHGGKTNGYTVPNPQAQAAVIADALAEGGVDARHVSYIEAHGTGTKLGDPIEIAAISKAFRAYTADTQFCLLGSAKSNIGHCESAAGIAGLTKVILQMQHRQIVPSLHSERLNPNIDFDETPFIVNQRLRAWEAPVVDGKRLPLIAGISSFGAGGANAHVVVEGYSAPVDAAPYRDGAACIVVLSARTFPQLRQKAEDLKAFVEKDAVIDLSALAYTLQVGREAMDERLAMVVHSRAGLLEKLALFLDSDSIEDGALADDLFYAQSRRHRDAITLFSVDKELQASVDSWFRAGKFSRLIDIWTKGLDVDWRKLHAASSPGRLHLPVYPFARERYWHEEMAAAPGGSSLGAGVLDSALHPLVHHNISKPGQQRYRSAFRADDARLSGIKLFGNPGVPHGVLIEAARAAVADALPALQNGSPWELQDVRFAAPHAASPLSGIDIAVMLPGQGARPSQQKAAFEISIDGDHAGVLCQGFAEPRPDTAAPVLDIAQLTRTASPLFADQEAIAMADRSIGVEADALYRTVATIQRTAHGLLLGFELSDAARNAFSDCLLPPGVLENALIAAQWLHPTAGTLYMPASIASIRIHGSCENPRYAWIQTADPQGDAFCVDIAICDGDGRVCVQLESLALMPAHAAIASDAPSPRVEIAQAQRVESGAERSAPPVRIADRVFHGLSVASATADPEATTARAESAAMPGKPNAIALSAPDRTNAVDRTGVANKPAVVLAAEGDRVESGQRASIVVRDRGDGIFVLRMDAVDGALNAALADAFRDALDYARELPSIKALVLESDEQVFLHGGSPVFDDEATRSLWRGLASFPYPTLAVLAGKAVGAGFWFACACDAMVAVDDQVYGLATQDGVALTQRSQMAWLAARFGESVAALLATNADPFSGEQLRQIGWGAKVVERARLSSAVDDLCRSLSDKSQDALRLLKQHLVSGFDARLAQFDAVGEASAETVVATGSARHEAIELRKGDHNRIHVRIKAKKTTRADAVLQQLSAALNACRDADAVFLHSDFEAFLPEDASQHVDLLRQVVVDLSLLRAPVVAVVEKNALNAGFVLALACDRAVCNEDGRYGGLALHDYRAQLPMLDEVVAQRLGVCANEWILSGLSQTGRELQQRSPSVHACSAGGALAGAQQVVDGLAAIPRDVFSHKSALVARIQQRGQSATVAMDAAHAGAQPAGETTLALSSTVVSASVDADGVVLVRLEDRDARNMFSDALIAGLQEVFDRLARPSSYKAVVLVGYDTYFSSGGTRDGLKAIQEGKVRFTDLDVFQLAMRCPLPVVAAMQGHGIGAGWTLGLFADCVLFSEESRYVSPYMNFGFTPGAGATGILPAKLGPDLARESLFTGREMLGDDLKRRNPLLTVVPRDRVLVDAMALAQKFSRHERSDLVAWKAASTAHRFAAWQALFAREVQMHEATLVGQSDALSRIEDRFTPAQQSRPAPLQQPKPTVVSAEPRRAPAASARADILPTIRRLLAEELRIDETEIDVRTPFIDLGLDSISSVTWIRKINEQFGLAIEATKVYTYPNLQKLGQHVGELLPVDAPAVVATAVVATAPQPATAAPRPALPVAMAAKPAAQQPRVDLGAIRHAIIGMLAQELRQEPDSIDADRGFVELGLDSISGVTWIRAINQAYGTAIEATKIYTYATVEKFARYLRDLLVERGSAQVDPVAQPAAPPATHAVATTLSAAPVGVQKFDWPSLRSWQTDAIAIEPLAASPGAMSHAPEVAVIGMAGSFPMAKDLDAFWENIANGRDCVSEIPASRWDTSTYYVEGRASLGQSNSKWMGVLEGHDQFDPLFFGLSPVEAEAMDPQQRVLLQCCWHGMENAGYTAERLSGSKCGVFVGCAYGDYNLLSREQQINALGFTGGATSILAARLSYFLNLQGPCVSIDTACSSSLVAISMACDSLLTGASELAFAGGVYVMANADMFLKTGHAGMLSPSGRCYTFDQRANGFVPGEGVGVIMLKRLADAERDGDSILAVVRGWGINQDGRSNGITAPNAESQQHLIMDVYDRFGLDPNQIQLIEAHGTGTKLGDPIEIEGLNAAFRPSTDRKHYCAIGSVKTNIGHCLTAAGVSGFIKLLLALKHRQLPPSIHFEKPNEHLDLADSPFYVNTALKEWTTPPGVARHAAISSFGFSGTNAHLVLGEYMPKLPQPAAMPVRPEIGAVVPLSARTAEQLLRKARQLLDFVQARPDLPLVALSHSLQVHRDAMDERLCFVAHDMQDVVDRLNAYIVRTESAKPMPADLFAAHVKQGLESVRLLSEDAGMTELVIGKCIADGNLSKLCELWVKGLSLDWRKLYGADRPGVIALPQYPFAEDAYWITPSESGYSTATASREHKPQHLHPLLQEKVADIREQGYRQSAIADEGADADDGAKTVPLMHLPAYSFARIRCWIPSKASVGAAAQPAQHGPFVNHLDAIAELFTELELDRLTTLQVVERVKSLA
ncbi:MAG: SDR family NAD(P)-dependent oxidoreductase [Lysobacter sp.]|nr:SDR family NAD(P)-dependent oxidoreductase [Lysobacter sp.]